MWRNSAATIKGAFTRGRLPVAGSQPRVSSSVPSIQSSVSRTAALCARMTARSPFGCPFVGRSAASDTDFGAENVMSKPGRCSRCPSRRRPSRILVPITWP